ncbi:MAG: OsmC family protein [Burkholderiales bacterium]
MSQATVKAALLSTIESIKANPGVARLVFRADTELVEDVRCSAKVRDFAPMLVDEPPELGGQDAAMNPVELVLVALGTCQEIMYSAYASVMGIPVSKVKVSVKGYLDLRGLFAMDGAIPPGYQKVVFETAIDSTADELTLKKLIETVESHCPVLDTLTRAIEVTGKVSINGGPMRAHQEAAATA